MQCGAEGICSGEGGPLRELVLQESPWRNHFAFHYVCALEEYTVGKHLFAWYCPL